MQSRSGRAVLGSALIVAGALLGSSCGSSDDDDHDPSVFRMTGNLRAVDGASTQRAETTAAWWERLTGMIVAPAIAQSQCATATLEACVETTGADGNQVQECVPVDAGSCSFDVSLALFDGASLFIRDVPSGRTAPIGNDVDPLATGCALLLCNVDVDFDRQVAFPELVLNSCANPGIPFNCGAIPTPTPRRGGGGPDAPTPAPTLPNLTPLPSVTPLPTATVTSTPNPTFTPIPTFTPMPTPTCIPINDPCESTPQCCSSAAPPFCSPMSMTCMGDA